MYLIGHAIGVWCFVGVDMECIIMAEDVLLDALIHIPAHGQKMLRTVFVLAHLLDPRLIAQHTLLIAHITLHQFLVLLILLTQPLVQLAQSLPLTTLLPPSP